MAKVRKKRIIVCRVAWMSTYRSEDEDACGGGDHVKSGGIPYEALNFLPIDGVYYGYVAVPRGGSRKAHGSVDIKRMGAQTADSEIDGVSIVFCATEPDTSDFLVVGWYRSATVFRNGIDRPGDQKRIGCINFKSTEAVLVEEHERSFLMPTDKDKPKEVFGGIGMANIWYGLNEKSARRYKKSLEDYMQGGSVQKKSEEVMYEYKKRRCSERMERRGSNRGLIHRKGFKCEACGWSIKKHEREIWGSSFELHHLTPFSELDEDEKRNVCPEDFAVLCASCHRAVHRSPYVSDVKRFSEEYI